MTAITTRTESIVARPGGSRPSGRLDFNTSPLVVFYELTQACDLACRHCRASAQPCRNPNELTTAQARQLITQLASFPTPPLLVLTGGDPLKRDDLFDIIAAARQANLSVALTPSATPLCTKEAIQKVADAGLHRLAVSLDAADETTHDNFRRVKGSFAKTIQIINDARAIGLPVQVNTTITRHNLHQVDEIANLLAPLDIVLWSVFFLVPTGRGQADQRISVRDYDRVFARLHYHTAIQPYAIKTTEAPHYRRYVLQQNKRFRTSHQTETGRPSMPMAGTNDGRGVMFISHTGEIFPSGFLPISAGKFPLDNVVNVYQNSKLFKALRDADGFEGKCGQCEYRNLCGGSRARAYALTNNPLESDPDCNYIPMTIRKHPPRHGVQPLG